ncbi:DNA-binding transcriptional LysR family regulator [Paenibacillus phyllosphaerae]|uniref:DNA-binding transcriptional LysR family regulator n=1 Tax=Paenibacillus phyllosphaerae TaxID=274593 RepID=A0A7W5AVP2_9BACL|nr:LysR family transcriptional regulator [Paenibacillus phyllosphaerae]MBB3109507.1 DNA-binding transcriptional LysR family regulator [Paenibacillus phyllosphaerae]
MNLYALTIFHHVAALGSVTKAAEQLMISQPAVTAHVRKLSAELGLTLLAPSGRGVLLTEAGQRVAAHARRIVALEEEVARDLNDYRSGAVGTLRIAATSLPANVLLPRQLARFRSEHPQVKIEVNTSNAHRALEALLHYRVDLAVIGGSSQLEREGLIQVELLRDEQWFIVSADHPLAGQTTPLAELIREPFIVRESGSAARQQLEGICRARASNLPDGVLQVSGITETIEAVAAGFGAAFVSSLEASSAVARGEAARVHVPDAGAVNPIMLVMREKDWLPPAAGHFAKQLQVCDWKEVLRGV